MKLAQVKLRPAADGYSPPVPDWSHYRFELDSAAALGKNVSRVSPGNTATWRKSIEELKLWSDREKIRNKRRGEWGRARERRQLRRVAQKHTESVGVGKCGWCRVPNPYTKTADSVVLARSDDGRAGWIGIASCGSVWECAECHQKVTHRRADEIKTLVDRHRAAGGSLYMLTLTGPHSMGDDLKPLRRNVSKAWQYVQTGKGWQTWKEKLGIVGSIRVLEVTHGPNAWHPHLHGLFLMEGKAAPELHAEFKRWVFKRWVKAFTKPNKETGRAYGRPTWEHGISWQPADRGEKYLTKLGLVNEITGSSRKESRGADGYRTPWQILKDVRDYGRPADVALWKEYATGMRGARQLTWTRGLRERYDLGEEQTDLDLAADTKKLTEHVLLVTRDEWDKLIRRNEKLYDAMLEAAAIGDAEAAMRALDRAKGLPAVPF